MTVYWRIKCYTAPPKFIFHVAEISIMWSYILPYDINKVAFLASHFTNVAETSELQPLIVEIINAALHSMLELLYIFMLRSTFNRVT